MRLTPDDVVCCPPPLFHCFGLVMGFLASFCHGSSIVFPSDHFDARRTLDAVVQEKATALLGVPTMFVAELEILKTTPYKITTLRTGLAAGSPVPAPLMDEIQEKMGVQGILIAYGMTETSPVTFITALDDPWEKKTTTLGRVLPHTAAKVVDRDGKIVPRGVKGEICTSGFALQKGYWGDEAKTREVMKTDEQGRLWMHTGDEGFIDEDGYGHITGRIKDLIIRGKHTTNQYIMDRPNLTDSQVAKTSPPPRSRSASLRTPPSARPASSASRTTSTARSSARSSSCPAATTRPANSPTTRCAPG